MGFYCSHAKLYNSALFTHTPHPHTHQALYLITTLGTPELRHPERCSIELLNFLGACLTVDYDRRASAVEVRLIVNA